MSGAQQLESVIVVMLENRGFDHLLGFLDPGDPSFAGVGSGVANPLDPANSASEQVPATAEPKLHLRVDPDHSHEAVMIQLGLTGTRTEPVNDGFVASYEAKAIGQGPGPAKARRARRIVLSIAAAIAVAAVVLLFLGQWPWTIGLAVVAAIVAQQGIRRTRVTDHFPGDGRRIMWCWSPEKIPAMATLARSFALCTRWFCSVPGETWPNRQFAHAATSAGTVDIKVKLYDDPTVFERLQDNDKSWRIYFDGPAQVLCYPALWNHPKRLANWHHIQDLFTDIEKGDLPAYSFVEPNHGYIGRPYSQHPGNNRRMLRDFESCDKFIAGIYEALRANPAVFAKTALVITYDEHGGTFDHVAPPEAVPPDGRTGTYAFDRLGARVPCIVVSPLVAAQRDNTVYDHTSIPATLLRHFAPDAPPLTARDKVANDFLHLFSENSPRTNLPDLSAYAWRPKAAWSRFGVLLAWMRNCTRPPSMFLASLGLTSAAVDEAISAKPAPVAERVGTPAGVPAVPTTAPRLKARRAVRKLAAAAEAARAEEPGGPETAALA